MSGASCSSCNQSLDGHPENYTMVFPPIARYWKQPWEGKLLIGFMVWVMLSVNYTVTNL